jgi:multiple sugar transport system permease protein
MSSARSGNRHPHRDNRSAYLLAGPWILGLVLLNGAGGAWALGISMMRWDGGAVADARWVGGQHYRDLLGVDTGAPPTTDDPALWRWLGGQPANPQFYRALGNSIAYSLLAVPLGLIVALGLAVLLHRNLRGIGVFQGLYYLPHVLGGVATVIVWSWVFNPHFGPVNQLLAEVYAWLDPLIRMFDAQGTEDWPLPGWLMSPTWCKPAVAIMHAWTAGGAVFIFLAALQRVDTDTLEAARLDGARTWARFRHVVLPQLTPALLFNLVTGIAGSMQAFNQAYLLYNRAQEDGLLFYMLHLYRTAFEPPYRWGQAAAMGWILFAVLLVCAVLAVISGRKWVHYAD